MIAIIGALSNWLLRGGGLEALLNYRNITGMRYVNAVLFGLCAGLSSHDWMLGVGMAAAMVVGQLWKIPHQDTILGRWWPMTRRGIIWCLPMVCVMLLLGYSAWLYIPAMFGMYACYRFPILYYETQPYDKVFNQVTVAEMAYGFLLWLPLCVLFPL